MTCQMTPSLSTAPSDYLSSFNIIAGVAPDTPDTIRQGIAAASNQRLPVALLLLVAS